MQDQSMTPSRLKFVVENDTFLRLIQVVLDPSAPQERFQAFAHFCLHDLPDFRGWCEKVRAPVQNIYPPMFIWSMITANSGRTSQAQPSRSSRN